MLYLILIFTSIIAVMLILGLFFQNDIFTKILFLNSATSVISLLICMLGTFKANSPYLDISIIYFILSTIVNAAYLKYFMQKDGTKIRD